MDRNKWIIFGLMCVALFGGLIYISSQDSLNKEDLSKVSTSVDKNGDHIFVNKDAKVTIIEYADYQCPACRVAGPAIKEAVVRNKDNVKLVFRNFPLTNIHPNALAAAAAAESAGLQNKFWEMHEKLFSNQKEWSSALPKTRTEIFKGYAEELGIDSNKFVEDLESEQVLNKIKRDSNIASKLDLPGTPSITVNDKIVDFKVHDNKIVTDKNEEGMSPWVSADIFDQHVIKPAIEKYK